MNRHIPEKDWKKLRSIENEAINAACDSIFNKITTIIESRGTDNHKAYLRLWKVIKKEDEQISLMFDDLKRSSAIFKLAIWRKNGILSDKDFNELTEETRNRINSLLNI